MGTLYYSFVLCSTMKSMQHIVYDVSSAGCIQKSCRPILVAELCDIDDLFALLLL